MHSLNLKLQKMSNTKPDGTDPTPDEMLTPEAIASAMVYLDMVTMELLTLEELLKDPANTDKWAVFVDGTIKGIANDLVGATALTQRLGITCGNIARYQITPDTIQKMKAGDPVPSQPLDLTALVAKLRETAPNATDLLVHNALSQMAKASITALQGRPQGSPTEIN
jgi:hypothetical protein